MVLSKIQVSDPGLSWLSSLVWLSYSHLKLQTLIEQIVEKCITEHKAHISVTIKA